MEFVSFIDTRKGKKLLKVFKSQRAANMFLKKNMDNILSKSGVDSIGSMSKKEWDTKEAKYAIEGFSSDAQRKAAFANGYEEKDKKNEGKKRFKRQDGIGKAKYTISYHDGKKKHKDGSDFFDIKIFKNKKDLSDFVGTLAKQGYKLTRESVNESLEFLVNTYKDGKSYIGYYDSRNRFDKTKFIATPYGNTKNAIKVAKSLAKKNKGKYVDDFKINQNHPDNYAKKGSIKESVNEGISVSDERHFGKKGIIIMIDDNGKKVSAIFKDKKNADKFNRNKPSDIKKLLDLAKKTKYPKAIDESLNEASKLAMGIAGFTGTRGIAVDDFINTHNIDAKKLFNFVKKGNLKDRMAFVGAIAGRPNNKMFKMITKQFGESINEAKFGYKDSKASYIKKHKDEYKQAEKMNNGNEKRFYDLLQKMEDKVGHPKTMLFISNALRGYKVDMYKDPKIKNPQDAQEALFLLSK